MADKLVRMGLQIIAKWIYNKIQESMNQEQAGYEMPPVPEPSLLIPAERIPEIPQPPIIQPELRRPQPPIIQPQLRRPPADFSYNILIHLKHHQHQQLLL